VIVPRQGATGVTLALAIISAWLVLHIYGVFIHQLGTRSFLLAPAMIGLICWLNVGMFIVAHDAMHGSLAPGRAKLNRNIGRLSLLLYAGFSYDRLLPEHRAHHRAPGTAGDPDFSVDHPSRFWPWYAQFFRYYFGRKQLLFLTAIVLIYLAIGANYANILLFWALPAILSSLQLFYFGTFLPHRHAEQPFGDHHNARSNGYGWLASLLSCFHFGYHHEHHRAPHVPWWRLPDERRRSRPQ
jgi:beta-carotene ketolase (CrtW type)